MKQLLYVQYIILVGLDYDCNYAGDDDDDNYDADDNYDGDANCDYDQDYEC